MYETDYELVKGFYYSQEVVTGFSPIVGGILMALIQLKGLNAISDEDYKKFNKYIQENTPLLLEEDMKIVNKYKHYIDAIYDIHKVNPNDFGVDGDLFYEDLVLYVNAVEQFEVEINVIVNKILVYSMFILDFDVLDYVNEQCAMLYEMLQNINLYLDDFVMMMEDEGNFEDE